MINNLKYHMNNETIANELIEYLSVNNFTVIRSPEVYTQWVIQEFLISNDNFEIKIQDKIWKFDFSCHLNIQPNWSIYFSYPFSCNELIEKWEFEIYKTVNKANGYVYLTRFHYEEETSLFYARHILQTFDKTKLTVILETLRYEIAIFQSLK